MRCRGRAELRVLPLVRFAVDYEPLFSSKIENVAAVCFVEMLSRLAPFIRSECSVHSIGALFSVELTFTSISPLPIKINLSTPELGVTNSCAPCFKLKTCALATVSEFSMPASLSSAASSADKTNFLQFEAIMVSPALGCCVRPFSA